MYLTQIVIFIGKIRSRSVEHRFFVFESTWLNSKALIDATVEQTGYLTRLQFKTLAISGISINKILNINMKERLAGPLESRKNTARDCIRNFHIIFVGIFVIVLSQYSVIYCSPIFRFALRFINIKITFLHSYTLY